MDPGNLAVNTYAENFSRKIGLGAPLQSHRSRSMSRAS
jgi:hypothetical protein